MTEEPPPPVTEEPPPPVSNTYPDAGGVAANVVSTYESMGIYWKGKAPMSTGTDGAELQFRASGTSVWEDGLPVWFDRRNGEYRGSLVNLRPGQKYDVRIILDDGSAKTFSATTQSNKLPIAKTIVLPTSSSKTLTITQGGTASGYVLYTAPSGGAATIDVAKAADHNIVIKADYVIVRGVTLKGAKKHAVLIGESGSVSSTRRNIVIESSDISAWGSRSTVNSKFGRDLDSAVYASEYTALSNLTVQRCKLHHPSYGANSFAEKHVTTQPAGPQALTLRNLKGGTVIRFNEIYSDDGRSFSDAMSSPSIFTSTGFPNQDADIHGNTISHVMDDAIEAAGSNRNVRIWGNYLNRINQPMSVAPVHGGPLYVWKNLSHDVKAVANTNWFYIRNFDSAGKDWGGGRLYVFNNTALKPRSGEGAAPSGFFAEASAKDNLRNIRSLNNVMQVRGTYYYSIREGAGQNIDLNYDLVTGQYQVSKAQEFKGVFGQPKYVSDWGLNTSTKQGKFHLEAGSPGYDAGVAIPNFLTTWTGRGPDMGAHEAMTAAMQFGVNAYK